MELLVNVMGAGQREFLKISKEANCHTEGQTGVAKRMGLEQSVIGESWESV